MPEDTTEELTFDQIAAMADEEPTKLAAESPVEPAADYSADGDADGASGGDLRWVWREARKRVFIKLPFSLGVAEALQAVVPIVLDEDTFVVGLSSRDYPLSTHLQAENVRNTIEGILRQAARHSIRFEVIEGTTIEEWMEQKQRRARAQEAIIAMVEQKDHEHQYEAVLNQIIGEIRRRITAARDRGLPQVRAQLMLDIVPSLADATEMLFADPDAHESRRTMARAIDRIAGFLDVPAVLLSLEIERYRRQQNPGLAEEQRAKHDAEIAV